MSTQTPIQVRVTHRFQASAERVFDAWLDAEGAARWMFATPTGEMVRAEIDPRVGGTFRFVDRRDGEDVDHTGEYLEIDRPRRLVFTFSVDGSEADRVTLEIAPLESGCELTLTHEMSPAWAEYAERAKEGWSTMLEGLADALGEVYPRRVEESAR